MPARLHWFLPAFTQTWVDFWQHKDATMQKKSYRAFHLMLSGVFPAQQTFRSMHFQELQVGPLFNLCAAV
jgi:hypothetical protein